MDLYSKDSKDIALSSAADLQVSHLSKGKAQFIDFSEDLQTEGTSFYALIKKNKVDFFQARSARFRDIKTKGTEGKLSTFC